jgi:hypothetical protein
MIMAAPTEVSTKPFIERCRIVFLEILDEAMRQVQAQEAERDVDQEHQRQ